MKVVTFIPREYYPAVMFARKMIHEGEPVGLACYKAARYYGVDQSGVASWLRGKKKVYSRSDKAKQKWYWGVAYVASDNDPEPGVAERIVGQTANRANERRKFGRKCLNTSRHCYTGSGYSPYFFADFCSRLFDSKEEAEADMARSIREYLASWGIEVRK